MRRSGRELPGTQSIRMSQQETCRVRGSGQPVVSSLIKRLEAVPGARRLGGRMVV